MSKYKLLAHPVSPFSYLAHATLVHKKIDFEFNYIDLAAGAQRQEEYLSINPFGQVPVLVADGNNIYESWSIFEFLEETHSEPNMLPLEQPKRARTRSLALALMTGVIPSGRELFMHALGRKTLSTEEKESVYQNLKQKLTIFQKEGIELDLEPFSPIDAIFYQAWQNLCFSAPKLKEEFPLLEAYFNDLNDHPTIKVVESNPGVQKVREFFKTLTPQA